MPVEGSAELFEAIGSGRADIVTALLEAAAGLGPDSLEALVNVATVPSDGGAAVSAVEEAAVRSQTDCLKSLLSHGAGALGPAYARAASDACRQAFLSEMLHAIARNEHPRVKAFLAAGVDVNMVDGGRAQHRPLHWAASFADAGMAKLLCDGGAEVNATNADGGTALHDAAKRGAFDIVDLLLSSGADASIRGLAGGYKDATAVHLVPSSAVEVRELLLLSTKRSPSTAGSAAPPTQAAEASSDGIDGGRGSQPITLDPSLMLLCPEPQRIAQFEGPRFILPKSCLVYWAVGSRHKEMEWVWALLEQGLGSLQAAVVRVAYPGKPPNITCRVNSNIIRQKEGYRILVDPTGVTLCGADALGLRNAVMTLLQACELCNASPAALGKDGAHGLPRMRITDWPSLEQRGFMLDVSRDKVPKLEGLFELVDLLARLKYNQLQLYMEHTFAYADHEEVWRNADPYTPTDILSLDAYCSSKGIALVPNQNSFGHFHRFLAKDRYRHLAECPDGVKLGPRPSGEPDVPFSLCATDIRSVNMVASLYHELLPHFPSSQFVNVGLDETLDLGEGRSKAACEKDGKDSVYLHYLLKIRELCRQHNRTMMFWADIVQNHADKDIFFRLPPDCIALEWGYEENHPFHTRCRRLADAGLPFMVCPGTSSWNSLTGRVANSIENVRRAVRAGVEHGALGMLLTDWGDNGHVQPFCVSYPGLVAGACLSWNANSQPFLEREVVTASYEEAWGEPELAVLLDTHVFRTHGLGDVLVDLGNVYLHAGGGKAANRNGTALFRMLIFDKKEPGVWRMLTLPGLRSAARILKQNMKLLDGMQSAESEQVVQCAAELRLCCELALFSCIFGQVLLKHDCPLEKLSDVSRTDLANRLMPLIERHKALWLVRNRPGGLGDSAGRLHHTLSALIDSVEGLSH